MMFDFSITHSTFLMKILQREHTDFFLFILFGILDRRLVLWGKFYFITLWINFILGFTSKSFLR